MEGTSLFLLLLLVCLFVFSLRTSIAAVDALFPSQSIKDGETLVSADGSFELGFFSPSVRSTSRFLGIWYKKVSNRTVVWVANRETPIFDNKGVLIISNHGILLLLNGTNSTVWSSNTSRTAQDPVALLMNSGNLVVKDGKEDDNQVEDYLWQSFDYACDTLLPGMKIGRNLVTGFERFLSSWKSTDDPAPGQYFLRVYTSGYPQLVYEKGSKVYQRAGSWNGLRFSGTPEIRLNSVIKYKFELNETEVYYTTELENVSVVSRYTLNPSGLAQRFVWSDQTQDWELFAMPMFDQCQKYGLCGTYGSCNVNDSPVCSCLEGFKPKSERKWESGDWTDGCVRRTPLVCNNGDDFLKRGGLKLPDTSYSKVNKTMDIKECRQLCLSNCSCTAYANSDIRDEGSGCVLWFGDLLDMRDLVEGGQDIYIRLATSEIDNIIQRGQSLDKKIVIIVASVIVGVGMLILTVICRQWRIRKRKGLSRKNHITDSDEREKEIELPIYNFATIANATNNFCIENKLGEGGFGPVFKGTLIEGQDIAVKRLSKNSGQGLNEFKNEIKPEANY